MLVALDGKILYRKAFGLANLEERTPITTATNFRLASVTKQFTATAVLLLAERGKLSLDDPLTRFFPGFARAAHGVKVRHLLGHTSGLLDYEDLIPPGTTVPLKDKDVLGLVGRAGQALLRAGQPVPLQQHGLRPAGPDRREGLRPVVRAVPREEHLRPAGDGRHRGLRGGDLQGGAPGLRV